jgi:serine/threonine protein kinase
MDNRQICQQCRQPLPENAPEGLCPACLARVALGSEPAAAGATININPLAEAAPGARVAPEPAQLAAQFPQLEILELLGMGGMGMVYKARQPRLDRLVALKILPVESSLGPSFAERFEREAKALARLNHPGIVTLHDFGQTAEYYYFIMEYVDGMNLRRLLQTQTLEPRQALELVAQICTALQFAHDEKIVHRDIKPENILLTKKGQVKIADFGLAKLLGNAPDTALTMSQAAMGTMNYMAPEQRQNAQSVDHRADIYSLGVVFYEMLTGEVPMGRFEAPSKKVRVDVRLDEVVLRALESEPARRYQQVSEVKTGVETITSTLPQDKNAPGAPAASNAPLSPGLASQVRKTTTILVLACLLGACAGLVPGGISYTGSDWGSKFFYWNVPDSPMTVTDVESGSPAEKTGFLVGDVLKSKDGATNIHPSSHQAGYVVGEKHTYTVERAGKEVMLTSIATPPQVAVIWYEDITCPINGALFLCLGIVVFATGSLVPPPLWRSISVTIAGLVIAIGWGWATAAAGFADRVAIYQRWAWLDTAWDYWLPEGLIGLAAAVLVAFLGAVQIRQRLMRPPAPAGSVK